jgi:hypothetical protein
MNERRARRTVTRREGGGRRPLTTAVFASITGQPFPLFPPVSSYRESGMGHPDAVRPPPAVSPFDSRVRVQEMILASIWHFWTGLRRGSEPRQRQ